MGVDSDTHTTVTPLLREAEMRLYSHLALKIPSRGKLCLGEVKRTSLNSSHFCLDQGLTGFERPCIAKLLLDGIQSEGPVLRDADLRELELLLVICG